MATRTITIESPEGNILHAQVDADLVDKFVKAATIKSGPLRGRKETFQHALKSAVAIALTKVIQE